MNTLTPAMKNLVASTLDARKRSQQAVDEAAKQCAWELKCFGDTKFSREDYVKAVETSSSGSL